MWQRGGCTPWILDRSTNPGGADNALLGVAAWTYTDAWAVGYQDQPNQRGGQTLIEHWNGTAWADVPSPNPSTGISSGFSGVTSLAANNAWAVGYSYPSTYIQSTLIEHWNGQTWQIVASPNVGTTTSNYLYAVTGTSASDVWAVGTADGTLVEHWNGTAWSIIPSPNAAGTTQDTLTAVTALSSTDVWAVGYAYDGSGNEVTLMLHWDGTNWSVVPSPNTSAPTNVIRGVSGSGPDDVWAVGMWDYYPTTYKHGPLIEHWNGSITPSPNPAPVGGGLTSVSAASPGYAVAVGSYGDFNGNTLPLIEQWTGTAWQQIAAAPILPYSDFYLFTGVSALSGRTALAVGYSLVTGPKYQTFAESTSSVRIMTPGSLTSRTTNASRAFHPQLACPA